MKKGSLDSFFKSPLKQEPKGEGQPPISRPAAESVEKELINELKQDEKSETKVVGENPVTVTDATLAPVPSTPSGNLVVIDGRMLLYGCDAIFPKLIIGGASLVGYKIDKKASDFMLTPAEIEMMKPSANAVAGELFQNLTPLQQFCGMMISIYAQKL